MLPREVFQFDVGMAVLMRLGGWFGTDLYRLLRAGMEAGEAGGTMRTYCGQLRMIRCRFLAVGEGDIPHGADAGTDAATDTFGFVDGGTKCAKHPLFHTFRAHEPTERTEPCEMERLAFRLYVGDDGLQAVCKTSEFPTLVIGVTPEDDSTVIRHTDLMGVRYLYPFLAQLPANRPDGVTRLCAARDDDKHIRVCADLESRNEVTHGRRRIEIIRRINETDTPFGCQILPNRFGQRQDLVVGGRGYLPRYSETVACTREIENHTYIQFVNTIFFCP